MNYRGRNVLITVNGQSRSIADGMTLSQLLDDLKLPTKFFAVEVNLQVAPRSEHAQRRLSDGDRLEIVTLVGGG